MPKSLLAIIGLGVGACLLLSWMMHQALQVQQERKKAPLAQVLEVQFEGRRVGPVRVAETREDGQLHLSVRLCVRAGLSKELIAESVGTVAWNHALTNGADPAAVVVEVGDDAKGPAAVVSVPRPTRRP